MSITSEHVMDAYSSFLTEEISLLASGKRDTIWMRCCQLVTVITAVINFITCPTLRNAVSVTAPELCTAVTFPRSYFRFQRTVLLIRMVGAIGLAVANPFTVDAFAISTR